MRAEFSHFVPNEIARHHLGNENKNLKYLSQVSSHTEISSCPLESFMLETNNNYQTIIKS